MEKHKAQIKEGEEFCSRCGLSPENATHTDRQQYGEVEDYNDGKFYFVDYVVNGRLLQARFTCSADAKRFGLTIENDEDVESVDYTEVSR